MYKNLIFDLDGTLCVCSKYYTEAQDKFVTMTTERTGAPEQIVRDIVESIDVICTTLPGGFNRCRFPRSFAAASLAVDAIMGRTGSACAARIAYQIAEEVFTQEYPLFDGISEMLQRYADGGFNLFLYTLGDMEVQARKIELNTLHRFFPTDRTYIVPEKTDAALANIITTHHLELSDTIMIGDSMRGDIGPAVRVGVASVWINRNEASWGYENTTHTPLFTLPCASQLPEIIPVT